MGNSITFNNTQTELKLEEKMSHIISVFILTLKYPTILKISQLKSLKGLISWIEYVVRHNFSFNELYYLWTIYFEQPVNNSIQLDAAFDSSLLDKCADKWSKDLATYIAKYLYIYSEIVSSLYPDNTSNLSIDSLFTNNHYNILLEKTISHFNSYLPKSIDDSYSVTHVPEIISLYYDSGYDYVTGKFTTISKINMMNYINNLRIFYRYFTGGLELPTHITRFSQISYKDTLPTCNTESSIPENCSKTDISYNFLFAKYGRRMRMMMCKHAEFQLQLISIFMQLFDVENYNNHQLFSKTIPYSKVKELSTQITYIIQKLNYFQKTSVQKSLKSMNQAIRQVIFNTVLNQTHELNEFKTFLFTESYAKYNNNNNELLQNNQPKMDALLIQHGGNEYMDDIKPEDTSFENYMLADD